MKIGLYALLLLVLISSVSALQVEILSTTPAPITAGEYADITVRISSQSATQIQNNLGLSIQENPFITQISPQRVFSSIRPGDQITTTLRVYVSEQAPEGFINVPLLLQTTQTERIFEQELFIEASARRADIRIGTIRTIPEQLLPNTRANELLITLHNLGDRSAELISAKIRPSDGITESFAYSFTDAIASLDGASQGQLTFRINIDESIRQTTPALLELTYRTRTATGTSVEQHTITLPFTIPITQAPQLRIISQELLSSSAQGTAENRLRITIENTGEEEATDVRVRLFPDISLPLTFERTSQFLGAKIKPNQTATLDIVYEVLSSAPVRSYQVAVELESLVQTTRYTETDVIVIEVREGRGVSAQTTAFSIIIGVIVLALIIGLRKRRSKKE